MASTLPKLSIFDAISTHDPESTAVIHSASRRSFTYGQLLKDVADAKDQLQNSAAGRNTDGERIAFMVENSYDYVGAIQRPKDEPGLRLTLSSYIAFDFRQQRHCSPLVRELPSE